LDRVSQKIDSQEFFGPYLSAHSVKIALKTIRKIWPFRDCSQGKYDTYAALGHGCLFATLKLCDAPCAAKISKEEYRANIDQIRAFLRGDRERVLALVEQEMEEASQNERYEQAAKLRDRLQGLLHVQDVADSRRFLGARQRSDAYQYDPERDLKVECYDISNIQGSYSVGSQIVGVLRGGKVEAIPGREEARLRFYLDKAGYRKYRIKTVEGASDVDSLREVLGRRFKRAEGGGPWALPDLVLLDGGKGQLRVIQDVRAAYGRQEDVGAASVAKGPTRKNVDLYGADWERFPQVGEEAWCLVAELLREEAHRFAITYYRSLHRKQTLKSESKTP
jgi:excinuclease ABC subunit C